MAKHTYTREERRAQFLKIGIKIAKKDGLGRLTAAAIAREAGVTGPLVFHVFGSRQGLQAEVRKEAKKQGIELGPMKNPTPAKKAAKKTAKKTKKVPPAKKKAVNKKIATLPVPSNVADKPLVAGL